VELAGGIRGIEFAVERNAKQICTKHVFRSVGGLGLKLGSELGCGLGFKLGFGLELELGLGLGVRSISCSSSGYLFYQNKGKN
jgi:hypothetical protein